MIMYHNYIMNKKLPVSLPAPTTRQLREEAAAFELYLATEAAKGWIVKTRFGSSRYATREGAEHFATNVLTEPFSIEEAPPLVVLHGAGAIKH
jgi:hypothetical protein